MKKIILSLPVVSNENSNGLCSFYETKLKIKDSDVKLNFKINSNGISVLDTNLVIPKKYKIPSVSFVEPSLKHNFKRIILLDDNSKYVIH